jgi:AraC-like DNA-binding protein
MQEEAMNQWPDQKRGEENPRSKLSDEQVQTMRDRHEMGGVPIRRLADEAGVSHTLLRRRFAEDGQS